MINGVGIKTFGSCEGHPDTVGSSIVKEPYVAFDISSGEPEESSEVVTVRNLLGQFYAQRPSELPLLSASEFSFLTRTWQVSGAKDQTDPTPEQMDALIAQTRQFGVFVKNAYIETGVSKYTHEAPLAPEDRIEREQVVQAFRELLSKGYTPPNDTYVSDDSYEQEEYESDDNNYSPSEELNSDESIKHAYTYADVQEAYDLMHTWQKQRQEAAERVDVGTLYRDAYLECLLEKETVIVDAGFSDPDYLHEVANELENVLDSARRMGSLEMRRKIDARIEKLYKPHGEN